jgi:hypothetical protein
VAAEQNDALPPLVPMRRFVANIDAVNGHVLSPDGQWLLSVQTVGTDVGLGVRSMADAGEPGGAGTRTFATGTLARPFVSGPNYSWLRNSRHIAYLKDFTGDENTQIFVLDAQSPGEKPWAVTPGAGIRSAYVAAGAPGSARFFFANNKRDRSSMDLFEADALTRTVHEVARSEPGSRVVGWFIDTQRELAGRMRQLGELDGSRPAAGTAAGRRQLARLQDRAGLRQLLAAAHRPRRRQALGADQRGARQGRAGRGRPGHRQRDRAGRERRGRPRLRRVPAAAGRPRSPMCTKRASRASTTWSPRCRTTCPTP